MKEQIIELLKQGRKLEAVATAHRLGVGSLQQAKKYVDAVEKETLNGNSPDDNDRVVRSWSVKYDGAKPVSITLRDQNGERQVLEGSVEWYSILAQDELLKAAIIGNNSTNEDSWNNGECEKSNASGLYTWKFKGRTLKEIILAVLLTVSVFGSLFFLFRNGAYGYWGLIQQLGYAVFVTFAAYTLFWLAFKEKDKFYWRILKVLAGIGACVYVCYTSVALVRDVFIDDVKVYQGKVGLSTSTSRNRTNYYIYWEKEDGSKQEEHKITRTLYYDLHQYKYVRVVYWPNTGVVKSVQPL